MKTLLTNKEAAYFAKGAPVGAFANKVALRDIPALRGSGILLAVPTTATLLPGYKLKLFDPIADRELDHDLGLDFGRAERKYLFGALSRWNGEKNKPLFQIMDKEEIRHILIISTISREIFHPSHDEIMEYVEKAKALGILRFRIVVKAKETNIFAIVPIGYQATDEDEKGFRVRENLGAERRIRLKAIAEKTARYDDMNFYTWLRDHDLTSENIITVETEAAADLRQLEIESGYDFAPAIQVGLDDSMSNTELKNYAESRKFLVNKMTDYEHDKDTARAALEKMKDQVKANGFKMNIGETMVIISSKKGKVGHFNLSMAGVEHIKKIVGKEK